MFRAARFVRGIRSIGIMAVANETAAAAATVTMAATTASASTSTSSVTATATATATASTTPPATGNATASTAVLRVPIPPRGVDYRGKVVLAPMVRSGELPSRLLALHYGADLVWGPETVDHSLIGATRRINPRTHMVEFTRQPAHAFSAAAAGALDPLNPPESVIYRLDPVREAGKLVFQLGTSDPARAVAAARLVAPDVAGIDVNAGCPKPFSVSGGMGAALLRTPDKLVAILTALTAEIPRDFGIGVSVKIRLLETAAETEALVRRLVATGITGLTVHCRTTPMRPRERAIRGQLRMIADVCREAGVACLMNGDVEGRDDAAALVRQFGVDGAMIATAAEKNPSCFRAAAEGGLADWQETVQHYLRFAMEVENRMANTKFTLTQLIPGKAPAYSAAQRCRAYQEIVEELGYVDLRDLARETDRALKLGEFEVKMPPKQKAQQKAKQQNGGGGRGGQQPSKKRKREEQEKAAKREAGKQVVEATAPAVVAAPAPAPVAV